MATADDARKWAKGFEDGIEPDQHLAVMPVKNLRLLIADLRRFADEHESLLTSATVLLIAWDNNAGSGRLPRAVIDGLKAAIAKANGQPAEAPSQ